MEAVYNSHQIGEVIQTVWEQVADTSSQIHGFCIRSSSMLRVEEDKPSGNSPGLTCSANHRSSSRNSPLRLPSLWVQRARSRSYLARFNSTFPPITARTASRSFFPS